MHRPQGSGVGADHAHHFRHPGTQRGGLPGPYHQPTSGSDDIGNATDVRRDNRPAGGQGRDQRGRQGVLERGLDDEVGGRNQIGDVTAETQNPNPLLQKRIGGHRRTDGLEQHAVAGHGHHQRQIPRQ